MLKFHVRFEDPASATRFGELRSSLEEGIRTRETGGRPDPLGTQKGPILAEDLAFLFDRLGVYTMEWCLFLSSLKVPISTQTSHVPS